MLARKPLVLSLGGAVGLLLLTGCFQSQSDIIGEEYQGGSNPISLGLKLSNIAAGSAELTTLNPDDLQLMSDLAADFTGQPIPTVSDELAAAAVELIAANNIRTFDDLANIQDMNVNDIVIPEGVAETVISEVQDLFGDINNDDFIDQVAREAQSSI